MSARALFTNPKHDLDTVLFCTHACVTDTQSLLAFEIELVSLNANTSDKPETKLVNDLLNLRGGKLGELVLDHNGNQRVFTKNSSWDLVVEDVREIYGAAQKGFYVRLEFRAQAIPAGGVAPAADSVIEGHFLQATTLSEKDISHGLMYVGKASEHVISGGYFIDKSNQHIFTCTKESTSGASLGSKVIEAAAAISNGAEARAKAEPLTLTFGLSIAEDPGTEEGRAANAKRYPRQWSARYAGNLAPGSNLKVLHWYEFSHELHSALHLYSSDQDEQGSGFLHPLRNRLIRVFDENWTPLTGNPLEMVIAVRKP